MDNGTRIGLSTAEAKRRRLSFGANEVVPTRLDSRLTEIRRLLLQPMGLLLLFLGGLYAALGDKVDAIVLFVAYIPVTAVDIFLNLRTSRALSALKATIKATAKVFRDGEVRDIPTREIVIGDVIVFEEGQSIPADGKLLEAEQLAINESTLTGESIPVEKSQGHSFFGGTVVLRGRGTGVVEKIALATRFGKVANLIKDTEREKSPLQKKMSFILRWVFVIALAFTFALFFVEFSRNGKILPSLIVALTFGMSAVPEEFPLVFTLYLSLGAWRLSRHGVLVKSLPSVETLGSVDVICTDKTGTLTEGKFQLEELRVFDPTISPDLLWRSALMACEVIAVDTMEAAIFEKGYDYQKLLNGWSLKWDYAFEPLGKHMSHVWEEIASNRKVIAMKGAVEGVLEHCEIDAIHRTKLISLVDTLAGQGKRILGLAHREGICTGVRKEDERQLKFIGLLIFSDPIRATAKKAIAVCQTAGIRIKMLTGDHPLTAHAVADQTGIIHSHDSLYTGDQLAKMAKEERNRAYERGAIFSRVSPDQKYELLRTLKANGEVVAMTGDGINDAPALKLADIGISMGENATDVARSSGQMVLLKNDFGGIVEAVLEGRRIFSNLKRSFSYLISFHFPVILLALIPPSLGWGDLFFPIHIVLLQLLVHPVSAFAFENLEALPSDRGKGLMTKRRLLQASLAGVLLSLGSLILFRVYSRKVSLDSARAVAFAAILLGNIFFVFVESWPQRTKRLFFTAFSLSVLTLIAVLFRPAALILHLGSIDIVGMSLALGIGAVASLPSLAIRMRTARKPGA
jgi:Ca2+-transporting ATPase